MISDTCKCKIHLTTMMSHLHTSTDNLSATPVIPRDIADINLLSRPAGMFACDDIAEFNDQPIKHI